MTKILPLTTRQRKSEKVSIMALWDPSFLYSAKMGF